MRCPECGGPLVRRVLPVPPEEVEVPPVAWEAGEEEPELAGTAPEWRLPDPDESASGEARDAASTSHVLEEDFCATCGAVLDVVPLNR